MDDVYGDGDCFYRALYKASVARGILPQVMGTFRQAGNTSCLATVRQNTTVPRDAELFFCKCARKALAFHMETSMLFPTMAEFMFNDITRELPAGVNSAAIYKIGTDRLGQADWVMKYFMDTPSEVYSLPAFIMACKVNIQKPGSYASELDVALCAELLNPVGIYISLHSVPSVPAARTLYLKQVRGNHYNWVDYPSQFAADRTDVLNAQAQASHFLRQMTLAFKASDQTHLLNAQKTRAQDQAIWTKHRFEQKNAEYAQSLFNQDRVQAHQLDMFAKRNALAQAGGGRKAAQRIMPKSKPNPNSHKRSSPAKRVGSKKPK